MSNKPTTEALVKNTQGAAQTEKTGFHPRNKHRGRYDFTQLVEANPELAAFVALNAYQDASIDFANPEAVRALNRALLKQMYGISAWNLPPQYLCPPIPGRADYLHYLADLLGASNDGVIPLGASIRVLDIGIGANIIYPLIGHSEYGWHFVGTEIDRVALASAKATVNGNSGLRDAIELRFQSSPLSVFQNILQAEELFDVSMCNPPFHTSLDDAKKGTERKFWWARDRTVLRRRRRRLHQPHDC
jgi:23S rRNA (adenine1618-N6)-methyltransferase